MQARDELLEQRYQKFRRMGVYDVAQTDEQFDLYRRYLRGRHSGGGMNPEDKPGFHNFLDCGWGTAEFWEMRLAGELIACHLRLVTPPADEVAGQHDEIWRRIGLPGYSVYSASKFGLRGFAQALRRELADGPVRVQYLGPRSTRTGFNRAAVEAYNRATGTAMDPPAVVAQALLEMLRSGRAERFLGFPERLGVRINGALPAVLDGSFRRHSRSLASLPTLQERKQA